MQTPLILIPLKEYEDLKQLASKNSDFKFIYQINVNNTVVDVRAERVHSFEDDNPLVDVTKIFEYGEVIKKAVNGAVEIKDLEISNLKKQLAIKSRKWYQKIFQ